MTDQQIMFYIGKLKLARLDEVSATRPLTEAEKNEKDEILRILFESIVRFGMSQARTRLSKYRKGGDAMQDIQQDLAVIFYEKLPDYDPRLSTPTTYYLRYFNQVITQYVLDYSQHMSQYDAHNVAIVRGAIRDYESAGIRWDERMIVNKTGLSLRIVRNTLCLAANSVRCDIDADEKARELVANTPTPEEEVLKKERTNAIYSVISSMLDEDEKELFFYKLNLDGAERTYQQVADGLGMQVRDVKQKWCGIVARLNGNRDLREYRHSRHKSEGAKITFQPSADASASGMMFKALCAVPSGSMAER